MISTIDRSNFNENVWPLGSVLKYMQRNATKGIVKYQVKDVWQFLFIRGGKRRSSLWDNNELINPFDIYLKAFSMTLAETKNF